ncbi:hypothetical protein KIN20_011180 [Parelaphostrongylus tenuis]|uniref:Uncharacterized protein n=1 Tax=Parelaphostrongylus tenuis TaxID=148309 RepID=A0AAD5QM99_PARTN|nr:hypothetical protein KIN20_011180 [Parelaphostrongylus tenuis]
MPQPAVAKKNKGEVGRFGLGALGSFADTTVNISANIVRNLKDFIMISLQATISTVPGCGVMSQEVPEIAASEAASSSIRTTSRIANKMIRDSPSCIIVSNTVTEICNVLASMEMCTTTKAGMCSFVTKRKILSGPQASSWRAGRDRCGKV